MRQFTATRFVRAIAAPPHTGAEVRVLAVLLYQDGFYVKFTYDSKPRDFDAEMTADQFAHEGGPEINVEDDLAPSTSRAEPGPATSPPPRPLTPAYCGSSPAMGPVELDLASRPEHQGSALALPPAFQAISRPCEIQNIEILD